MIRGASIASLVDVRTVPKSRRHPQFVREAMSRWVPEAASSSYRWEPRLGGFRKTRAESPNVALRHPSFRGYADYMETGEFVRALAQLLADAADAQTAVMCWESLRASRWLLVSHPCWSRSTDGSRSAVDDFQGFWPGAGGWA